MRSYRIDLDYFGTNETHSCLLVSVHTAQSWAKFTIAQMGVSLRPLLCCFDGGYQMIAGNVVVEEERRGKMELARRGLWLSYEDRD